MFFLILCILSSTGIFIIFKSIDRLQIPALPVIVINYLSATILGFLISRPDTGINGILEKEWLGVSMVIGVLFIVMFFLVDFSTRKAGISVTTVASKMSVIFPVVFSLLIDRSDQLTSLKFLAILCTLAGLAMTVYRPREARLDAAVVFIPLLLFTGMGLVDSLVKFAQYRFVNDPETALFSAVLFLNALLTGIVVLLALPRYIVYLRNRAVWFWGLLLGGVNFGSIFFIVRALNYISPEGKGIDSSLIFGVNNTCIVALSVLSGLWIFRERLLRVNWFGIGISVLALVLFALGS